MGTISDKLMRVINTKEDIRKALIFKGYDVPASIPFKEYAKMILDLPCKIDDFPELPGDVTRWRFGGLTNEMMAAMDDPRIEDMDHKGRFLSFKNFAWSGMSGVNGYKFDFLLNEWVIDNNQVSEKYSYKIVINNKANSVQLCNRINLGHIKITLKITGIEINKSTFRVYDNAGTEHKQDYTKDGIYEIDYTANEGANIIYFYVVGGNMGQLENPITIEQLPLYPGALVFDGVDDYGVCENFPILTKEKGYTVVALRQWITRGERALGLVSNVKNWLNNGAFLLEYRNIQADHLNKPISFGAIGSEMDLPHILTYQTSKSYNGVSITTGNFEGTDVLHVGKLAPTNVGTCINAAIWELVFLDHDATEEELTKIKDYFVKTYPWLFPDQAWTVVGKTNEDEDRATIANITGNGNNLVLSNLGFAEGSGYGLYAENYAGGRWVQSTDRADLTWTSYSVNITSVKVASTQLYYQSYPEQPSFTVPSYKIKVYGLKDGQTLSYKQVTSEGQQIYKISEDGIYTLPSFLFKANGDWYGFTLNKVQETCDITIEQIPEYEGYLVTDGVDDIASSNTVVYEADFTFIGEWKFIQKDDTVAGINSVSHLYIQNRYNRGATVMINSTFENKKNITDYMTFKAITSKGKGYDENWNEVDLLYGDGNKGPSQVSIGGQGGSDFCHMIFKNMALYMNKVFSKDECIKAYNYLQTIKAK